MPHISVEDGTQIFYQDWALTAVLSCSAMAGP